MLDKLFLQILNMSFTASFVIVFVLLIRLLLKKTPKIFSYALWSVVLFRLICPFSFESVFSVLPTKANPVPTNIGFMQAPQIDTGIPIINDSINPILPEATPVASINPLQIWMFLGEILWLSGIVALLIYSLYTLYKLIKKLKGARCLNDNIYMSDNISTAFVLGVVRPKIYLPLSLNNKELDYILLHEQTHIKRLDHIVKILAFLVLCVHWFNPLVWVAFFAFSKDMEQACDEAVIKTLGNEVKKDYSASLLSLATGKRIVGGTPLAFGEGDTKGRVENVLNYKKPAFWVIVVSVIAVALSVFCLVSNPQSKEPPTLYAYSENGVIPLNLGTYSWNGVEADSISYTEMEYKNAISYNENKGHHNANIFFSTSDTPSDFNTDNAKGTKDFKIVEMKRFVGGKEEVLDEFGGNIIEVSLEQDTSYLYVFKVQFGENHAYYSVKINNNVEENSEPFIKKVVNGAVSATTANNQLSKEIVMNSMLISAAFEGIDIDSLDNYYHIRYAMGKDSTMENFYVFLLDQKPVTQFGRDGRYVRLDPKYYEKLQDLFLSTTNSPRTLQDTDFIQITLPSGNPAYGNKGKTITDKDEIADFVTCFKALKINREFVLDIGITEPSYYRFYNGTELISEYQFNGNDTEVIWNHNEYNIAKYKGKTPFALYEKSTAEEVVFYQNESDARAVGIAKDFVEDSEENKIKDYLQPKVEKRTIDTPLQTFDVNGKKLFELKGQTVYQITFETEKDEILEPIVVYVDAGNFTVLGIGSRR